MLYLDKNINSLLISTKFEYKNKNPPEKSSPKNPLKQILPKKSSQKISKKKSKKNSEEIPKNSKKIKNIS